MDLSGNKLPSCQPPPETVIFSGRQYTLHSIVRHRGKRFASGHYVACLRKKQEDGKWEEYNDAEVTERSHEGACAGLVIDGEVDEPYLLFYARMSGKSPEAVVEPKAAGKEVSHKCNGACGKLLPKDEFSKKQLVAGLKSRKCKSCVDTGEDEQKLQCNGACGLALPREQFSKKQHRMGKDTRKCKSCVDGTQMPKSAQPPCPDDESGRTGPIGTASGKQPHDATSPPDPKDPVQKAKKALVDCQDLPSVNQQAREIIRAIMGKTADVTEERVADYPEIQSKLHKQEKGAIEKMGKNVYRLT